MLALMGIGQSRYVKLRNDEVRGRTESEINQAVITKGQNRVSRSGSHVSVSPGDVIEWLNPPGNYFEVELIGSRRLSEEEFFGLTREPFPSEEQTGHRLDLVLGIDPLSGMPSEMKVDALMVLRRVVEDKGLTGMLKSEGVVSPESIMRMKNYVELAAKKMARQATDHGTPEAGPGNTYQVNTKTTP